MKINVVRHVNLGVTAGLSLFLGCAPAQPEQPKAVVAPVTATPIIAQATPQPVQVPTAPTSDAVQPAPDTNAPAIVERIPPTARPETVAVSPGVSEVVKLAQSGVGEEVILAYVDKYAGHFNVGADQVLYLNDLGVSEAVITSMLRHDGNTTTSVTAAPPTAAPLAPPGTPVNPTVTAPLTPEGGAPVQVATGAAPPPTSPDVSYFYDTLSPYGSWVYLSGYGWCWQPTVAVTVATWRPYCDRGRWYWSDGGWYWNSDYSWGWAAFHYGRWYHHPGCGWVWTPGVTWAPSWVSWRYSDGYCGWAPLPPEAHFVSGVGFTYYGSHVSVGFEFGLTDYHYSFVHLNNFCDYAPYRYVVPHNQVHNFYHNTTVVNNYIVGNNNTVINRGIGRDTIARASTTRVRDVSIKETQVSSVASIRGDRIEKQGNQTVVYRPQLPKTPPQIHSAQFVSRPGGQGTTAATVSRQGNPGTQVTTPAPGNPRGQSGVATRQGTGRTVEAPAVPQNQERQGRAVGNQRGANTPTGQNAVRSTAPTTGNVQAKPQPVAPPQQPRNAPLFGGDSTSGTAANNQKQQPQQPQRQPQTGTSQGHSVEARSTPTPALPRNPQQNNYVASPRVAPAAPAYPYAQQPRVNAEQRVPNRVPAETRPAMSPKQYEQAPRYAAPGREAVRSAPQPAPARPSPGGGNTGGAGAGGHQGQASRAERPDRNR